MARRQLPLPEGIAPARRPAPSLPNDDDTPPPPIPSRPTPGRPGKGLPPVPSPSVPSRPPPKQKTSGQIKPPQKTSRRMQNSVSSDDDDDSFESDGSGESYEDMSGREPHKVPTLPKRGYLQESEKRRPLPPPAKKKPPPEPEPDEQGMYADGDAGEIYDEAHMGEQEEDDEQETYDDMEVGEATNPQQEVYAACDSGDEEPQENYDDFGGVAQDTYEIEEQQEEYQECDVGAPVSEDMYQVTDDDAPTLPPPPPAAPSLPPPRPRQKKEDVAAPPPPRDTPKKPAVKGSGMPAIGMGDILNIKDRLKKVEVTPSAKPKTEPKVYTDHNELKDKFNFFKQKEKEALARGTRPEIISPKPKGFAIKKSTSLPEDQTDSPVLPSRPSDLKPKLPHRNTSDSLPPVPSPKIEDLPSPPPDTRDLPPPPPDSNPPQPPPPRGKDGYTKVNVQEEQNGDDDDDDDGQEIYDDAMSFEDPLLKESWYFGEIDRMVGNEKLKKLNQNGAYLLRKSTKGGDKQPFTLMVIYKNHVYNLKIRERNDGRVALGEDKPDEMSFKSVADLIKHHQSNDVILVHRDGKQDSTLLIKPPPK